VPEVIGALLLVALVVGGVVAGVAWMLEPQARRGLMERMALKMRQGEVDREDDLMVERYEQLRKEGKLGLKKKAPGEGRQQG